MKAALVLVLLAATALAVPHTARTDLRIVDGHSVSDPNPFPWVAMVRSPLVAPPPSRGVAR